MTSGKQRRREIVARRRARGEAAAAARTARARGAGGPAATAPCNAALLAPYNSYGVPAFVERGYYVDTRFTCARCGADQVWRATQQKWWYEVAKGNVESRARLCRECRRLERERRDAARKAHLDGLARKSRR
jgi:hypothetical protein